MVTFLHTADWHLGKILYGIHLTTDQAALLDQLVDIASHARVDAVIIAGDIYDRSVPPPEAVALLDDLLSRIVDKVGVPLVMIAGNHDSPDRLGFASRLLAARKVHIAGPLRLDAEPVLLRDDAGPVRIYSLPYAEPPVVRDLLQDPGVTGHQQATAACTARILADHPEGERSILVAHAFVAGGVESQSERPLSVGGSGTVDAGAFQGFDYVALGHLHRPQELDAGRLRYSGSLMNYSFSEIGNRKSVSLVEMGPDGRCRVEAVPLVPPRDLRVIEGRLEDLLRAPEEHGNPEDYLLVRLTDPTPVLDAMTRLRAHFPNALAIERPALQQPSQQRRARPDQRGLDPLSLFPAFFRDVVGREMGKEEREALVAIGQEIRLTERKEIPG